MDAIDGGYELISKGVGYAMDSLAVTLGHIQAANPMLLDECAIWATSDVSSGWDHGMQDFPALVIGKGGRLRGDTHIAAPKRNLSDVLLTLAQNSGVTTSELGLGESRSTTPVRKFEKTPSDRLPSCVLRDARCGTR